MALMSTSLNVVSIAAVFCASLRRRAMVCRSRVIFTRSSRAASFGTEGARICVAGTGAAALPTAVGGGATASAGAGGRCGLAAALPPARPLSGSGRACRSPARRRPRGPSPPSACGPRARAACRPCRRRAAWQRAARFARARAWQPAAASRSAWWGDRRGDRSRCRGRARQLRRRAPGRLGCGAAPSLMDPSTEPTATVVPCGTLMSASTPAAGAGTSSVTLSVSSSTSGSSTRPHRRAS